METSAFSPYRSEAARDECFAYYDSVAAREWPAASEGRTVDTKYGPTFVRITGSASAPPLVLLPGAVSTSLMWTMNVEAVSADYRTIAVDQIGDSGRSLCTTPVRSFDDLRTWLDDVFDALQLKCGINLAGMSFGGALAAQYALRCPDRLNRIVLLAPGATVLRLRARFLASLAAAAIAPRRCLPMAVRWMFADMLRKDPKWIDATLKLLFMHMRSLAPRKLPLPPVLSDAQWSGLKVPALVLIGEHEVIYSAHKAVRRLKRVAPNVAAEIIPGAGHDLPFVQADMVNRKILEFLRTEPAGADQSAARVASLS